MHIGRSDVIAVRVKWCEFVLLVMKDEIIESAEEVHSILGGGYTESVYHSAMIMELSLHGIPVHTEGTIPIMYKGGSVGRRRPDLFIKDGDGVIIVELKAGSNRGEGQLGEYIELVGEDSNFGEVTGGLLVQFNEDLEYAEFGFDDTDN